MGCATSTDDAGPAHHGGADQRVHHRHHHSDHHRQCDGSRSESTNPLAVAHVDAGFKHVHVAPIPGVLHTLDGTLEHPTASDAFANSAEVERRAVARMARHRSASVVLRDRSGYEAPQPSAEEHVAHIERLGAIAGIHGLTPDPQQFAAPEVPASVIERHAGGCRSWMSGVVHPMPQALDGPPAAA